MLSFIVLTQLFHRRSNEPRPERLHPDGKDAIPLWRTADPPEVHDTSYADAIFDAHTRNLIRSDFAGVEPPPGVYNRVLADIRAAEAREAAVSTPAPTPTLTPALKPTAPSGLLATLRKAIAGPALARMAPSGVALLLALAALAPNLPHALRPGYEHQQPTAVSADPPAPYIPGLRDSKIALNPEHDRGLTAEERAAQVIAADTSPTSVEDEARLARAQRPLKQLWLSQFDEPQYENRPQGF